MHLVVFLYNIAISDMLAILLLKLVWGRDCESNEPSQILLVLSWNNCACDFQKVNISHVSCDQREFSLMWSIINTLEKHKFNQALYYFLVNNQSYIDISPRWHTQSLSQNDYQMQLKNCHALPLH